MTSEGAEIAVTIVPFGRAHLERTYGWVRDPELRHLFLMRGEVTREGHRAYWEEVLGDPAQQVYAVCAGGTHVGNCGLKRISPEKKEGELWIYLGHPAWRGKGIGRRATELLMRRAFVDIGLERVYLHVASFNTAARELYRSLGFTEARDRPPSPEWEDRGGEVVRLEGKRERWMSP